MLDRDGIKGLNLRGLADQLGGGLGSVYWYVKGKDELVLLACEELLGRALVAAQVDDEHAEVPPLDRIRQVALAAFDQMDRHPWLAAQVQLFGGELRNGLRLWEHLGRPLAELGLTPHDQFNGSTAVRGYVVGVASEMAAQDQGVDPDLTQAEQLTAIVDVWRGPEFDDLPWIRSMADQLVAHDDRTQFIAGLDLLLDGLRRQVPTESD